LVGERRVKTIRRADRLIALDHGRIVEEGTHAELLELRGWYARLYQSSERKTK
jgi:ABC-type multidrug transport system fused ATPase/permease subunit